MTFELTWLGTAGFHLSSGSHSVLIDPYFSRLPLHRLVWAQPQPDLQAISAYTRPADAILITHSHIDHLLDAPIIAHQQSIPVYGTHSTARLLQASGLPQDLIRTVQAGDEFSVGDLRVKVHLATHMPIPGFPSHASLPALHTPLKAVDYQMDFPLSFQVTVGDTTFLTDPGNPPPAAGVIDFLALSPYHPPTQMKRLLQQLRPRVIIPSHWDMFWRPLSAPLRAPLPWQYLPGHPHCRFVKQINTILPDCQVLEPMIFTLENLT